MPVIPSFASFGPKPNLAGAFNQGAEIALSAQRAAAQIALEKQRMAQSAAAAEAQYAQRAQIAAADSARQAHRDETERAYRMAEYGMKQRELEQADKKLQMAADQAAQHYAAQQNYQRRFNELYKQTGDANSAARQAMLESNPSFFGSAGSAALSSTGGSVLPVEWNRNPNKDYVTKGGSVIKANNPEPITITTTDDKKGIRVSQKISNEEYQRKIFEDEVRPLIDQYQEQKSRIESGDKRYGFANILSRTSETNHLANLIRSKGFDPDTGRPLSLESNVAPQFNASTNDWKDYGNFKFIRTK